jgi:signal transduction histidine kinase/ligand-binding sensor domain-containing protein
VWCLALTIAAASPTDVRQLRAWSVEDGLPQSSATAVAQDDRGFLYVGTFGGLVRFDGRRFDVPSWADGATWSTVRITALAIDGSDTRWIGLQDGRVVRIDADGGVRPLPAEPSLAGHAIWWLSPDPALPEGAGVWVAGSGGAARHDGTQWIAIEGAGDTRGVVHHAGVTWLGGLRGLSRVVDDVAVLVDDADGHVAAMGRDADGVLVAGASGVGRVVDDEIAWIERRGATELAVASDGAVWAASASVVRVVGQPLEVDVGSEVRNLVVDREGVVWAGTNERGIVQVVRQPWRLVDTGGGGLTVFELENATILASYGCDPGGLVRVEPDGEVREVMGGCVRAIARHGDELVLGVGDQLVRLDERGTTTPMVDVESPVVVVQSTGDALYVGTATAGAFRVEGGVAVPLAIEAQSVWAIAPGRSGEIWLGTNDGVVRFADGAVSHWSRSAGAPPGEIRALHVDDDGTLWFGSYGGGLAILRQGVVHRITRRDGLVDDTISRIIADDSGGIWLHGNRGLSYVTRSDVDAHLADPRRRVTARHFATPEGNGGGSPAGVVLRDGTFALPTVEGLVRFDPRAVWGPVVVPALELLQANIDGVSLVPGQLVEVPAGAGVVDLELTSPLTRHPELARFEYRVLAEGDADEAVRWTSMTGRRIHWAGFSPGRFRIELRVVSDAGVASDTTLLAFDLAAPWHERGAVRIAIVLVALALLGGAALWRNRIVRAHFVRLQRESEQRLAAEADKRALQMRLDRAERLEAVGRLAGGIAHDFNNLLAAIRGCAAMLPRAGEAAEIVADIDACVDRGGRLTRQLLSFAQRQHLEPERVDVGHAVRSIERMLRASLPSRVRLVIDAPTDGAAVTVDAAALDLALVNLVLNARDAMPDGGELKITVRTEGDDTARARWRDLPPAAQSQAWVVFEVADHGVGIPAALLPRVLEPFFTTRAAGTGLGLPSVQGFAAQSGGGLFLESTEGVGTRASIVLPLVGSVADARDVAAPQLRAIGSPTRVMVVDDKSLVRETLARTLRNAGLDPTAFADPREALAALEAGAPCDVLLTDMRMPGMSGAELAEAVRVRRPEIGLVFMSGFAAEFDATPLPGRLLTKPFKTVEVLDAIHEVARARPRVAADA